MRLALSNSAPDWRGTETMAAVLARGLRARGHDIMLLCRRGSPLHERLRADVTCEPVLTGGDFNPRAVARAWAALRRHRSEIVVVQKEKDIRLTGLAAWLRGTPLIVRHETDRPLKSRPHYRFLYGRAATHHITNSHATRRTLLASADWLRPDDVSVIPNGIDVAALRDTRPADLGLPGNALAVGYVGRLEERKGARDLALAWPTIADEVANAYLVIAGAGELEQELRGMLTAAPRVHWIGFRSDAAAVIRALDVIVVPSHFEGFGLSAVEAMAAGVPIVAADASSLPEVVTHDVEGVLVPPRAPAAMAQAVITLLRDPALRARLARAGAARVSAEFTIDAMLDAHERLLGAHLVAGRPHL